MKEWLVSRLKEKTSWAGLATVVGSLSFIPAADSWSATIAVIGTAVAGVVSIWTSEIK